MRRYLNALWVAAVVAGCSGVGTPVADQRSTDAQALFHKTWQWEETVTPVEKITVADPGRYTILFAEGGSLQARFDCNRGGGSYRVEAGHLSFGPMMSTRMACPEDTQDALFMRDLERVSTFFIEGDRLYLELPYDSGTMKFRPAP